MQTFLFADLSGFTALTEAHGDEQVGAQRGFPLVRVGMHTGSAVERDGDWFGSLGCAGAFAQPNRGATALRTRPVGCPIRGPSRPRRRWASGGLIRRPSTRSR